MPTKREFIFAGAFAIVSFILIYTVTVQLDLGVFLATAVGSLAYVLFSTWDEYVSSPRLEIEYDPSKPDLNVIQLTAMNQGVPVFDYRSIKLLIRNIGRKSAKGCVGYIELVKRDEGCTMFSFHPKVLAWIDIPKDDYIPPRGGFAVLGVAFSVDPRAQAKLNQQRCNKQTGPTTLNTWAYTPEVWAMSGRARLQDAFCTGDFTIKVSVFSESSQPVIRSFMLKVSDNWQALAMGPAT